MKYGIIIRGGIPGCGNTLVRLILEYLIGKSKVIGTHRYVDRLEDPIDLTLSKVGIIIPYRDFRSALASQMRKRRILPTYDTTIRIYEHDFIPAYTEFHKFRIQYPHPENVLLLRYPLFYKNTDYLLDQLQNFLAIAISEQQRSQIKEQFSIQTIQKKIVKLGLKDWTDVDKETLLHGNHIGNGRPDSWKTFFPPELHKLVTKLMWQKLVEYDWEKGDKNELD